MSTRKTMEKKGSSTIPDWMGNHPFPPGEKKPFLLTRNLELPYLFGEDPNIDFTPQYFSTDKISLGEYTVPPGGYFAPPDIHAGDECYYCLEGEAVLFGPESGDVFEMRPGDALLIPKGTWHQAFNFSDRPFRLICVIAPRGWADDDGMGTAVKYSGPYRFYKGEADERR